MSSFLSSGCTFLGTDSEGPIVPILHGFLNNAFASALFKSLCLIMTLCHVSATGALNPPLSSDVKCVACDIRLAGKIPS